MMVEGVDVTVSKFILLAWVKRFEERSREAHRPHTARHYWSCKETTCIKDREMLIRMRTMAYA